MIEVRLNSPLGQDVAEADDPDAALLTARTLWDEAWGTNPIQGMSAAMSVSFLVDGALVRMCTTRP